MSAPFVPIERDSPALGTLIDQRQVAGLPLDGRNFLELALLAPGTAPAPQGSASSVRGDFAFSVNGAREDFNNYLLDGVYNVDPEAEHAGRAAAGRCDPRVRGARPRPTTRRSGGTPAGRST